MNYNVLKESIMAVIKANGNEEITGDLLQQVLLAMTNALGVGYQFVGVAVPTTNPGTPDARIYYVATQAGSYNNFTNPVITLNGTQLAILKYDTEWSAIILDVPTKAYIDTALGGKVDKIEGKGLSTNDLTDELKALIESAFQTENVVQGLGDSTTKVISQDAITKILLGYAKVDGYYGEMTVGAAENLVGRGSVPADYTFRTSGGSADIGTGAAQIIKFKGKTIAWNQLVNTIFNSPWNSTGATNPDGSITITPNAVGNKYGVLNANVNTVIRANPSHKYLLIASVRSNSPGSLLLGNVSYAGGCEAGFSAEVAVGDGNWKQMAVVTSVTASSSYTFGIMSKDGAIPSTFDYKDIQVFDLTLMGIALEISSPADFEALYPGIYSACAGKLKNNDALAVVTTGFNQWDEEWEMGLYDATTGAKVENNDAIRSKNLIPVFPQTYYFMKIPAAVIGAYKVRRFYYDANKNFLQPGAYADQGIFMTPAGTYYMTFQIQTITTYNNDININLHWSGYRDCEYEPYWKSILNLNLNNIACHENDNAVVVNGLDGVGSSYDEGVVEDGMLTKIIKRRKRVNLGDLSWVKTTAGDNIVFYANLLDGSKQASIPSICSKYSVIADASFGTDKAAYTYGSTLYDFSRVGIRDSAYDNATENEFANAMEGVEVDYELATPVVLTLDNPIPVSYRVDDFGTEERISPEDADDAPSAPIVYEVQYAMNAVDTLRRLPENYISTGSFENFCAELADKLGTALDKTITITPTYNSESMEYDFAITIADIPAQES